MRKATLRPAFVRLSAVIDTATYERAKELARASGFGCSFSAYLRTVLERDIQQKSQLLAGSVGR